MRPEMFWQWVHSVGEFQYQNALKLDCFSNKLTILTTGCTLQLNEAQKRLFTCLMHGRTSKQQLQHYIWYDNPQQNLDNSYHQLLHQTRQLLARHQLPAFLFTAPSYGARLNTPLLTAETTSPTHAAKQLYRQATPLN